MGLHDEMHEYYKRQNTAERWTAYIMFGWIAFMIAIPVFIMLA